ncbi:MAG: DUF3892 domain-containing protein, partial [Oscillospiraceae bacterium]|nr:DUF3892 domain-containing protein [Oscillospiraceae bacterium]
GVVALVFLIVIISLFSGDSQVTRSTVRREALPSGAAMDSGPWYTDHLGWIGNQTQLLSGLRNFHGKTGVRPHLYLTGEIDGSDAVPTLARLESFANQTYSELFNDEAHLLLVFFENEDAEYAMYAMPGNMARSVMDDEARDILMDYIQRFYYSSSLSEEEMFSRAFDETGERIMTVTRSPWIPVLIVLLVGAAVIAGLLIGLNWWKKAKAQKNLEAEQTERILGQSLEEFGSSGDAASELAKQYSDPPSPPGDIIPVFKSSAQRIVAIRKEGGSIAAYRLAGGRILNKQDAVEFAKLGEIADVCISHRDGAEFLKALPDGTDRNNLSSLPEF